MKKLRLMALASLASVLGLPTSVALAQTPAPTPTKTKVQERVYGSQLMTAPERNEYRQRMREFKTGDERVQFQKEHHVRMQERAKERGLTLPDAPPAQGQGAGPRDGSRPGMAPGAGPRGPGGGTGRP